MRRMNLDWIQHEEIKEIISLIDRNKKWTMHIASMLHFLNLIVVPRLGKEILVPRRQAEMIKEKGVICLQLIAR